MTDSTALAVTDRAAATWDPFQLMDRWDDEALLAELQGAILDTLVYEFPAAEGQAVVGLSKAGVDQCCLALAEQGQVIRDEELAFELMGEGEEREALFKVKAARFAVSPGGQEVRLDQVIGVKRQPLYTAGKRGRQFNPHWYETGAMKAARNARLRLIPAHVRERVIQLARERGRVRRGEMPPARAEGEPADRASEAQRELIRTLLQSHVWTDDERRRGLADLDRLTRGEASRRIDRIRAELERRKESERAGGAGSL